MSDFDELFGSKGENIINGAPIPARYLPQLEALANAMGVSSFMIQDTETTGVKKSDKIYEFGAVIYQNGTAKYIHYYVEKGATGFDAIRAKHKGEAWAQGMPTDAQFELYRKNGMVISNDEFIKELQHYKNIPQFAYNALFDIAKENQLLKTTKMSAVYDVMTMAADIIPEVLDVKFADMPKDRITLQKVYKYLYNTISNSDIKKYHFLYDPRRGETHKAAEDVMYMTVPVLLFLFDKIQEKAHKGPNFKYSINNFKNLISYWEHVKTQQQAAITEQGLLHGVSIKSGVAQKKIRELITSGRFNPSITTKQNFKFTGGISSNMEGIYTTGGDEYFGDSKLLNRINQTFVGKTAAEKAAMQNLIKDAIGNGPNSTKTLLRSLQRLLDDQRKAGLLRKVGYGFEKTGVGGELTVYLVPNDNVFLGSIKNDMSKLPHFTLSIANSNGILSYYGMKGINQLQGDIRHGGRSTVYTTEQAQIIDVLDYLNHGYGFGLINKGDYRGFTKAVQRVVRDSMSSTEVAGNYVSDKDEFIKAMSGTGTKQQLMIRKSLINLSRFFAKIMSGNDSFITRFMTMAEGRSGRTNPDRATSQVLKDLKEIALVIGSYPQAKADSMINGNPHYRYLTTSPNWKAVSKQIHDIVAMGISAGTSGENSFEHMVFSTMSEKDLATYGGFSRLDSRKGVQATNTRELSPASKIYRQNLPHSRVHTATELANGISSHDASTGAEEALFGYTYITPKNMQKGYEALKAKKMKDEGLSVQEFEKRYGKPLIGAYSGGSLYVLGSDFEQKGLESVKRKTTQLSLVCIEQKMIKLNHNTPLGETNPDSKHYQYLRQLAIRQLLNLPKDVQFEEVYKDENTSRIVYLKPMPMKSGYKILTRVDEDRTTAQGIHPELFKYILADAQQVSVENVNMDNIHLLKEKPTKFSSSNVAGLIGGYLNAILVAVQNSGAKKKSLKTFFNTRLRGTALDGVFRLSPDNQVIIDPTQLQHITSGGSVSLKSVINLLNTLGKEYKVASGDAFTTNSEGNIVVTAHYRAMSQMGQADVARYGDPVGKVVSADYRFKGAVQRSVGLFSAFPTISKTDLSRIGKFLESSVSVSTKDLAKYKRILKEEEHTRSRSIASGQIGYKINKKKTISVGYESGYDIDLSSAEYDDLQDAYVDGHIDYNRYQNSLLALIDEARHQRAKELGVKDDEIDAYLDLGQAVSTADKIGNKNYTFTARHIYIPRFDRLRTEKDEQEKRNYTLPSFATTFNSLVNSVIRRGQGENVKLDDRAFTFVSSVYDYSYNKSGGGFELGNKPRLSHSMMGVANAGNPLLITNDSRLERNLATGDIVLSYEDLYKIIRQVDYGEGKSDTRMKNIRSHSKLLRDQAVALFEGSGDAALETAFKKLVDTELSTEIKERNAKRDAKIQAYKLQMDSWEKVKLGKLEQDLANYKGRDARRNEIRRTAIDSISREKIARLEKYNKEINEQCENDIRIITEKGQQILIDYSKFGVRVTESRARILNDYLARFVANAVTFGTDVYEARQNKEKGLESVFARFPLSNGLDVKYVQVFGSNQVVKNQIIVNLGGRTVNLDFDGDYPPVWMPLLNSIAMGKMKATYPELSKQFDVLRQRQKHSMSAVALGTALDLGLQKDGSEVGVIKDEELQELQDFQTQIKAAIGGKEFKGSTGALSNSYQAVTQAMQNLGLDETTLSHLATLEQKERAMYIIVARAFFEKLTQDAISSKKVFNRLKIDHPNMSVDDLTLLYLKDLEILLGMINDPSTFDNNEGIHRLVAKAQEMKILDFGADRITLQVLSYVQDMIDENNEAEVKAFARIFGVDYSKVKFTYDADGNVITIGGHSVQTLDDAAKVLTKTGIVVGKDKTWSISDALIQRSIVHINDMYLKEKNTNLGWGIKETENKPGTATGTVYRIGSEVASALSKMTQEAALSYQRVQSKYAEMSTNPKTKSTRGFKAHEILDFFNNKMGKLDMAYVNVKLNSKNHKYVLNEGAYTSDEIDAINKIPEYMWFSATQIADVLHSGSYSNDNGFALRFGTLHHQAIEDAIRNKTLKSNKAGVISKANLVAWLNRYYQGSAEDRALVAIMFDADGNLNDERVSILKNTINEFMLEAHKAGLTDDALIETPLGIVLQVGDRKIIIGGTIDQIWQMGNQEFIGDAKTSSYPYLTYVIQLSLYNAMRRACLAHRNGNINTLSPAMKIFLTQKKIGVDGGTIDVDALSDTQLANFIQDALDVLHEANEDTKISKINALIRKWNPQLQARMHGLGNIAVETFLKQKDKEFSSEFERVLIAKFKQSGAADYETWVLAQKDAGLLSEEAYKQHAMFSGARATYFEAWVKSLSATDEALVKEAVNKTADTTSMAYMYRLEKSGQLNFVDINTYNKQYKIEVGASHFKSDEEEEQDMLTKDTVKMLQDVTDSIAKIAQALAPSGGSAPSNPGGGTSGGTGGSSGSGSWNTVMNDYAKASLLQDRIKNEQAGSELYKATQGELSVVLGRLFGEEYLKNNFTDMTTLNIAEQIQSAAVAEASGGSLHTMWGLPEYNGTNYPGSYDAAVKAAVANADSSGLKHKLAKEEKKRLENTKKLYEEILDLQNKINIATRNGNQEAINSAKEILTLKQEEYETSGKLTKEQEEAVDRNTREKREKANNADLSEKERRYSALLRQKESLHKQIYRNNQAQRLTYSPQQRRALQEEVEILQEQWATSEGELSEFRQQYGQDAAVGDIMARHDNTSSMRMARNVAGIDVANRGNHTLWGQLGTQMGNIFTRFTQMGAAYRIIGQIRQGINHLITSAKELDKSLTNLRIVTGANNTEAKQMLNNYAQLGDQLGATTTEVANSAQEWLRQGYEMSEVTDLVTASIYLSKLGMMDATTATKDLTNIQLQIYYYKIIEKEDSYGFRRKNSIAYISF